MAPTCNKCGNTNHPPGARTCAVCGAALPATPPPVRVGGRTPVSSPPMLVVSGGRRYRLNPNGETLIGSRGCAIILSGPNVAPKHARVSPAGGGFVIEDLGGGMQVNGVPVTGPTPLQPGDTVTVGTTRLVYQAGTAPVQVPRPPVVPPPPRPRPPARPLAPAPVRAIPSQPGILADGEVRTVDPERQDNPPFDPGRALVILSIVMVVLGLCAAVFAISVVIWIVLLIVGLGGMACLLPTMLPLILSALNPLLGSVRGRQTVSILNFQVLDGLSGRPVDVSLIRKRGGGGNVRLGDKARVWGMRQANTGLVRAYRVEIYESGGQPTSLALEGDRPWPIWIGLGALGLTVLGFIIAGLALLGR